MTRTTTLWLALPLFGLLACEEETPQRTDLALEVPTDDRREPLVVMDAPANTAADRQVRVTGTVSDLDQPAATLVIELSSDVDGLLWRGNADGDGAWSWRGRLTEGPHLLQATVVDATEVLAGAWAATYVGDIRTDDRPPACRIVAPNTASLPSGEPTRLQAYATDDTTEDADLLYAWYQDGAGPLFLGNDQIYVLSGEGMTDLTVRVTDLSGQTCEDTITVDLTTL